MIKSRSLKPRIDFFFFFLERKFGLYRRGGRVGFLSYVEAGTTGWIATRSAKSRTTGGPGSKRSDSMALLGHAREFLRLWPSRLRRYQAAESGESGRLHVNTHPGLHAARPGLAALGLWPFGPRRWRRGAESPDPQAAARLSRPRTPGRTPKPMAVREQTPELAILRPHHSTANPHQRRHEFRRSRLLWAAPLFPQELPLPPEAGWGRSFLSAQWWCSLPAGCQGLRGCTAASGRCFSGWKRVVRAVGGVPWAGVLLGLELSLAAAGKTKHPWTGRWDKVAPVL